MAHHDPHDHQGGCTCGQCHPARPATQEEALALLDQCHQFPCAYTFKVIGLERPGFCDEVMDRARRIIGAMEGDCSLESRPSSGGKYLAVTLTALAPSSQAVLDLYTALRELEGVKILV